MVLFSNLQKAVFWVGLLCAHFSSTAARKSGRVLRRPELPELEEPPRRGTPSPTTAPPTPGTCPSGDDIEFVYEGLAGVICETISFFLSSPPPAGSVSYSHSLYGSGSNVPGNDSIGLTPYANSVINQPDAGNYIFVAIVDKPGCPAAIRTCLLDCVPGGPSPSVNDPPYCEYAH
jgi:hypothetical protein